MYVCMYVCMLQVAYETELSGTPTAVFTEIQLIGQFLVLGIIILILSNQNIVVILASQKSFDLIAMLWKRVWMGGLEFSNQ